LSRHWILRILFIISSSGISTLWLERAFFGQAAGLLTVSVYRVLFFVCSLALYVTFIYHIPQRFYQQYPTQSVRTYLHELHSRRTLVRLWLTYRIEARYAQTILGILWVVLLPVSTSLVLAFALTQFVGHSGEVGNVPYVAFLLAGLAIFEVGRMIILRAQGTLYEVTHVINRVYFPREIVLLVMVGEVLVDFCINFVAMVGINALFFQVYPNIYYIFIPLIVLIMVAFSLGLALMIGWYGLLISDLQPLLTIIMQLLFYLTVLFSRTDASSLAITILHFNPLALLLEAFRDVVLYAQAPNMLNLAFMACLALALLYVGYITFKVNENRFVEVM
jgi:lipopolysaccharide transport system permease protein